MALHLLLILLSAPIALTADKLLYVIEYGRHGARFPELFMPWNSDPMGLTSAGVRQQYLIGRAIRDHYKGFLDERYNPKQIRVQSSYNFRTVASAYSRTIGLFGFQPIGKLTKKEAKRAVPPNKFDYSKWIKELGHRMLDLKVPLIPVKCLGKFNDPLLEPRAACPSVTAAETKARDDHVEDIEEFHRQNVPLYKDMFRLLNLTEDKYTFDDMLHIRNILFVELYEGLAKKNEEEVAKLVENSKFLYYFKKFDYLLKVTYGDFKVSKVMSHTFLSYVKKRMLEVSRGFVQDLKYEMFVASDTLLHALLHQLGYYDAVEVPFSFTLHFELYQRDSGSYYVNALFNTTSNRKYELKDFAKMITDITYSDEEFEHYCKTYKKPSIAKSTWVLMGVGASISAVVVYLVYNWIMKKEDWKEMKM